MSDLALAEARSPEIRPVVGFTGTRRGMSDAQYDTVRRLVAMLWPVRGVHGVDRGADRTFDRLCIKAGVDRVWRPAFAATDLGRVFKLDRDCAELLRLGNVEIKPAKPPLDRNHDIVADANRMIATPFENFEVMRSGTWATIRYTRKAEKPLYIVRRDGSLAPERIGWVDSDLAHLVLV